MGNETTKKDGGLVSRPKRRKGQATGEQTSAVQSASAQAEDTQRQSETPPSHTTHRPHYYTLGKKYSTLASQAEKLAGATNTHNKRQQLEELKRTKADLDQTYAEYAAMPTSESGNNTKKHHTNMEKKKKKCDSDMQLAEQNMQLAEQKVEKNAEHHDILKSYQGSVLIKVIQHAGELSKEDKTLEDPDEDETVKSDIQKRRDAAVAHEEIKASHDEKADLASSVQEWGGSALDVISNGMDFVKSLGEHTGEFKDEQKKAVKYIGGVKDTSDTLSSILGIISVATSAIQVFRGISKAVKHDKKGIVDNQESWLNAREIMGNLVSMLDSGLGFVGGFIESVPILGDVFSIMTSGLQIGVNTANLCEHRMQQRAVQDEKKRLWLVIENKRKKYADSGDEETKKHSAFYDIEGVDGDDKIDAKRRELLKTVHDQMVTQAGTTPSAAGSAAGNAAGNAVGNAVGNASAQGAATEKKSLSERFWDHFKVKSNKADFADAEKNISTRIAELRKSKHESTYQGKPEDYKRKMRSMKALQLMNQYRALDQADKKMSKSWKADAESIGVNCAKIVNAAISIAGAVTAGITTVVGAGGKLLVSAYGGARKLGSFAHEKIGDKTGANANKQNTRSEMAEYLFDRMVMLSPQGGVASWDGDFFMLGDSVKDYKIKEEATAMRDIDIVLKGLGARKSSLIQAPTSDHMKDSLAAAYSQAGN
ncbi:MAG: hypothetical protein ACI4DO_06720 [Roseburia sp.]